ncbi:hypothetical protein GCM10007977_065060 [Dactylosporangium sucinum]|uniref:Uncharacterized protein n=1 Tax=Dactylosporangium sucinum TaxID=1424081 RepID=A0A917U2X3_9ACTN|nr:hypothetical protein GCM10007977_065060 [Dactylosporangium sucinum]
MPIWTVSDSGFTTSSSIGQPSPRYRTPHLILRVRQIRERRPIRLRGHADHPAEVWAQRDAVGAAAGPRGWAHFTETPADVGAAFAGTSFEER